MVESRMITNCQDTLSAIESISVIAFALKLMLSAVSVHFYVTINYTLAVFGHGVCQLLDRIHLPSSYNDFF